MATPSGTVSVLEQTRSFLSELSYCSFLSESGIERVKRKASGLLQSNAFARSFFVLLTRSRCFLFAENILKSFRCHFISGLYRVSVYVAGCTDICVTETI